MKDLREANAQAIKNDDRNQPPDSSKIRRGLDPELQAMAKIDRILSEFARPDAVGRIIRWMVSRWMISLANTVGQDALTGFGSKPADKQSSCEPPF